MNLCTCVYVFTCSDFYLWLQKKRFIHITIIHEPVSTQAVVCHRYRPRDVLPPPAQGVPREASLQKLHHWWSLGVQDLRYPKNTVYQGCYWIPLWVRGAECSDVLRFVFRVKIDILDCSVSIRYSLQSGDWRKVFLTELSFCFICDKVAQHTQFNHEQNPLLSGVVAPLCLILHVPVLCPLLWSRLRARSLQEGGLWGRQQRLQLWGHKPDLLRSRGPAGQQLQHLTSSRRL